MSSSSHSRNIRDPPVMTEPYSEWKEEVYIWSEYVKDKTPLEKQGLALFLSLDGDARKAAAKVKLDAMKKADGLQTVLKELDKFFLKDKDREAFLSYDRFHAFKRPSGMSMKDFLMKFELLRNTCCSYEVDISDKIIAHQMLEAANLPTSKKELVKTTLKDFSSDDMRNQILKVFCEEEVPDVAVSSSDKSQIHVKSEVADEDSINNSFYGSYGSSRHSGERKSNRNRKFRKSNRHHSEEQTSPKRNPLDEYGNVTQCDICKSVNHYAPKCPDKPRQSRKGNHSSYSHSRKPSAPSL